MLLAGCGQTATPTASQPDPTIKLHAPAAETSNQSADNSRNQSGPVAESPAMGGMSIYLAATATQFTIRNTGTTAIENLELTTYTDPLTGNILLLPYSFKKAVGSLKQGESVTIDRSELTNDKGAKLSDSRRTKVGACLVRGRVGGEPSASMFVDVNGTFRISPADTKWAALTDPILGPVDEPRRARLEVEALATQTNPPLVVILINREATEVRDLEVRAFPPPRDGRTLDASLAFTATVGSAPVGKEVVIDCTQFTDKGGKTLGKRGTPMGVLHLVAKVGGQVKERYITLGGKGE